MGRTLNPGDQRCKHKLPTTNQRRNASAGNHATRQGGAVSLIGLQVQPGGEEPQLRCIDLPVFDALQEVAKEGGRHARAPNVGQG